jgi:hypothetical protein
VRRPLQVACVGARARRAADRHRQAEQPRARYTLQPLADVAAEQMEPLPEQHLVRHAEYGLGVVAELQHREVGLAQHQQRTVGLNRAGEVYELSLAVRELGHTEPGV